MFKFVVLCGLLAAATAAPGAIIAPLTYSSNVFAPGTSVYPSYPSNFVYSSPYTSAPLAYSAPWGYSHLIKKRSAPLAIGSYIAPSAYFASSPYGLYPAASPLATSYAAAAPLTTTYTASAPLATTYGHPVYTTATHLIKKRSPQIIVPSSYAAPYAAPYAPATHFVPTTYTPASPYVSAPFIPNAPFAYNTHFIK